MSAATDEFMAIRLNAARVLMTRDGSDDVVLRLTSADGERNYILSRSEFVRLAASLSQDAQRLSTMQRGGKPS